MPEKNKDLQNVEKTGQAVKKDVERSSKEFQSRVRNEREMEKKQAGREDTREKDRQDRAASAEHQGNVKADRETQTKAAATSRPQAPPVVKGPPPEPPQNQTYTIERQQVKQGPSR